MALPLAVIEFIVAGIFIIAAGNSLRKRKVAWYWRIAFGTAIALGVALGTWFGFYFKYQLSPSLIVYSFPVPGAFHVLETYDNATQQWVDFVVPAPVFVAMANACAFPAALSTVVWLAHTLSTRSPFSPGRLARG